MQKYLNNENRNVTSLISNCVWLTIDDVVRILKISRRTLQSYRDKRLIPFYQVGRKIYFKSADVDEFLELHHVKARCEKGVIDEY